MCAVPLREQVQVVCGSGPGSVSHVPTCVSPLAALRCRSGSHIYFWGGSAHRPRGDAAVTAAAPPLLRIFPRLKGTFQYITELLERKEMRRGEKRRLLQAV